MSAAPDVDSIVSRVQRTAKYAPLCESVIRRAARQAASRYRTSKEAEKATRRRLHQVYGAYLEDEWLALLSQAVDGMRDEDRADPRSFCRPLLDLHASTRERVHDVDDLFGEIFEQTGPPSRILDLACGLNPIAIPWMGLAEACHYTAVDLHAGLSDTLSRFFGALGVRGEVVCGDALDWSDFQVDVVMMLTVLPCLARQEKDADLAILRRIQSPWVVVSYPARSLSGRDVGMSAHYEARLRQIAERCGRDVTTIDRSTERVYVMGKSP